MSRGDWGRSPGGDRLDFYEITEAPQPDGQWNRQGCMIVVGLSVILWAVIICFGAWIYRWGINVD